jgi:GH43 family beta-xylosidase
MMRFTSLLLAALLALINLGCSGVASKEAAPQFSHPLVLQRADPQVFLHSDGYYYMAATVPEYDRIELRRAKTLKGLTSAEPRVIWRQHADGPMSYHIWAPELHFIDGKWFVYFTAGRAKAIWDIRLYVLEAEDGNPLEASWQERGQLKTGWESFSLDATTFAHRGQRYLLWTQTGPQPGDKPTHIYIARMDTPLSINGAPVLLSKPDYAWEKVGHPVNEAPAVLVRRGRVFVSYSASATDANYCLGLLSAAEDADLLDPASWRKSPLPVFKSSANNSQFGPGHNSFTTTPDGRQDVLVYHARNYRDIQGDPLKDRNRHTRAQPLRWHADGTPDFGEPGAD